MYIFHCLKLMGTSLLSVRSREEDGFIDTWLRNNDYFRYAMHMYTP